MANAESAQGLKPLEEKREERMARKKMLVVSDTTRVTLTSHVFFLGNESYICICFLENRNILIF